MAKEIKSKEDIQEVVNEQDEKLTALDAKLAEAEAGKTEMAEKLETATNNVADLIEQVKTLHLNVVAKDTWKQLFIGCQHPDKVVIKLLLDRFRLPTTFAQFG